MACDRRSFLLALMATGLLPGCASAAPPAYSWAAFAARFLGPEGRIIDTGNGGISHSEGQGYGMLLAEAAGDRQGFDRLWQWTDRNLARKDVRLFSWQFDPRKQPALSDPNNASDGDILIAWALLRAAARWKDSAYAKASRDIRAAILQRLIWKVAGRTVLLPGLVGFVSEKSTTLNLSYYIWPAFDAFQRADGKAAWGPLIADGEKLMIDARFGQHHLPADWIDLDNDGTIGPAREKPPRFGFDAVRIPLYLAWGRRGKLLSPFQLFWSSFIAAKQPIPAWIDVISGEVARYPLSHGANTIVEFTTRTGTAASPAKDEDYFATVIGALTVLARK